MAFDNIVGTTLEKYVTSGKATDNIFSRTAALDFLNRRAKLDVQSGRKAIVPVEGATNTSFQNYSGYDTLTPVVDEIIETAEYDWKQSAIYVPMSGLERAKNEGPEGVIRLAQAKMNNAEMTAAETFEDMFFNGTGSSTGHSWSSSKEWIGLATLVGTTSTAGGINGTTETWWRSYHDSAAEALSLTKLANGYNSVSYGADKCDFEVTTQTLYEKYEALLQQNQRFTDANTGKAGFDNLMHKSGVVVWSDYTPSGEWYFLNSRHIKLTVLDGEWMKWKGFIQPYDKDAEYGMILCYGAFTTDGRRYLGKLSAKTA